MKRRLNAGDVVVHFKKQDSDHDNTKYIYKIIDFARHTENGESLVIYQAMYPPFKVWARPYDMFMSKVDKIKYPDADQEYRFEKYEED